MYQSNNFQIKKFNCIIPDIILDIFYENILKGVENRENKVAKIIEKYGRINRE